MLGVPLGAGSASVSATTPTKTAPRSSGNMSLEGIVSKKLSAPYRSGRSATAARFCTGALFNGTVSFGVEN
jgi:hypothetical protein